MTKIKITKRTVKVAPKDYIAFDTDLPAFGGRVMPSGKRFFLMSTSSAMRYQTVAVLDP